MGTYNNYYKINSTDLIDAVMPVGTVYLSISNDFNPNTAWGGTWNRIGSGYCLWTTTTSDADVPGTIAAGLPNITGNLNTAHNTAYAQSVSGVFYGEGTTADRHGSRGYQDMVYVVFDASDSNSTTYGKSSTVQPPAYKVYAWRRTA